MKTSHINLLLLSVFLIFAVIYWNVSSSSTPQSTNGPSSNLPPGHIALPSQSEATSEHINIDALKARVEGAPNDTTLLNHLAQVLHDEGKYEEAAVYYEKFLKLSPQSVQGWLDLANVYAALKEWDKALEASTFLLDFVPHHPSAMYNMGAIHANLANFDEAIYWWTQVRDQQENPDLALQATQSLNQIQSSSTP